MRAALIEARAQIIWGQPADSVQEALEAAGFAPAEAAAHVESFLRERAAEIRWAGRQRVFQGIIVAVVGLATTPLWRAMSMAIVGVMALIVGAGLISLGILYVVRGATVSGSVNEIQENIGWDE